jgi:dGTPase
VAARVGTELTDVQRSDIARFEGNAQGFRIVTRLQMPDNPGGLQLTCATLGAFAKYPVDSLLPEGERKQASAKKFSFFDSERELFAEVAAQTGLLCRGGYGVGESRWCRHPLAFIVEAADDICYRLVDFEDGMRVGLLSYEEVSEAFLAIIGEDKYRARAAAMRYPKERIEFLRALAIGKVIAQSASVFLDNEEAILSGRFETPLIDQTTAHEVLERIVKRSRETIYINARGLEIEAAGFEVVGGLLDIFVEAVEDTAASAKAGCKVNPRSRTLLQLVPEQVIGENKTPAEEVYTRLQRMTDFVSGMTDSYAVSLYKKLRGISLPGQ